MFCETNVNKKVYIVKRMCFAEKKEINVLLFYKS